MGMGELEASGDGAATVNEAIAVGRGRGRGGVGGGAVAMQSLTDMLLALQLRVGDLDCEVMRASDILYHIRSTR